jgi:hypothetical protein
MPKMSLILVITFLVHSCHATNIWFGVEGFTGCVVCEIFDIIYVLLFLRLFSAELCDAHEIFSLRFFLKETLCEDMNLRYRL